MRSITMFLVFAVLPLVMGMAKTPPEKKQPMQDPVSLLVTQRPEGPAFWKGGNSSASEQTVLVDSADAWALLWKEKIGGEAPPVDFSNYTALAVFLGSRNTGGYGVEFLPPTLEDGSIILGWREKKPAPSGFVIQAFTQPYAIQLYRKTDAKIEARTR